MSKLQSQPGEKNGSAKLKTADVLAIRADRRPVKVIAFQYGISIGQVSRIRLGRKWRHIETQTGNP